MQLVCKYSIIDLSGSVLHIAPTNEDTTVLIIMSLNTEKRAPLFNLVIKGKYDTIQDLLVAVVNTEAKRKLFSLGMLDLSDIECE